MRDAALARTSGSNGGLLGQLVDDADWSTTSLGPIVRCPGARHPANLAVAA